MVSATAEETLGVRDGNTGRPDTKTKRPERVATIVLQVVERLAAWTWRPEQHSSKAVRAASTVPWVVDHVAPVAALEQRLALGGPGNQAVRACESGQFRDSAGITDWSVRDR
jgi:hypothetical protein